MEGAAVVGHGDGGCRLLATAREAVELFAPPDGIEVFQKVERERERQKKEKKSCGFRGCLLSCPKRWVLRSTSLRLLDNSKSLMQYSL